MSDKLDKAIAEQLSKGSHDRVLGVGSSCHPDLAPGALILAKSSRLNDTKFLLAKVDQLTDVTANVNEALQLHLADAQASAASAWSFGMSQTRFLDLGLSVFGKGGSAGARTDAKVIISVEGCFSKGCFSKEAMPVTQYVATKLKGSKVLDEMASKSAGAVNKVFVYHADRVYYASALKASKESAAAVNAGAHAGPVSASAGASENRQYEAIKESQTPFPIAVEYRQLAVVTRGKVSAQVTFTGNPMAAEEVVAFEKRLLASMPRGWAAFEQWVLRNFLMIVLLCFLLLLIIKKAIIMLDLSWR